MVIEELSVSCFVLFLSNSKWWPSWSVQLQKNEMASCNNCSGTKLDQFQSRVLRYCHFHVKAILVTALGSHLGQLICLHLKKFNSGTILIKFDQNTIMFSRDIDIMSVPTLKGISFTIIK